MKWGHFLSALIIGLAAATARAEGDELDTALLFEEFRSAESNWERELVRELIVERAVAGETFAMTVAGLLALDESAGEVDQSEAVRWLEPAAKAGDTAAMWEMAKLHSSSESALHDARQATEYARRAADRGHVGAAYLLYQLLLDDVDRAIPWLRLAANHGHVEAARALGTHFATGRGVPADPGLAYFWLKISDMRGDPYASDLLDAVSEGIPADKRTAIVEAVREWRPAH